MLSATTARIMRQAAFAACALSLASVATPSRAEPAGDPSASIYTGAASNFRTTNDRYYRTRSARTSRAALRNAQASTQSGSAFSGFGSSNVVSEARRYIGTNPTGRSALWCANFMNMVLQKTGYQTTGSNMAQSFASYGRRVSGPQVGAIAVMSRGKRGGHVGVVSGIDANGNPIIISGNHNRRVAEVAYPRGRIYAYVMPN